MTSAKIGAGIAAALALLLTVEAGAQETRRYDYATNSWQTVSPARAEALSQTRAVQQRRPAAAFMRKQVRIETKEAPGTIIVDSQRKYLYFVEGAGMATRYGVGVGKEGFGWSGNMKVGRKAEWPGWTPPAAMIKRERAKGRILPAYMAGGPANPLGARAMYLYRGGRDSLFRIHGTNQPWTIGQNMSSGCVRMMNEDVEHLYSRVPNGTKVIVIGPRGEGPKNVYADLGPVQSNILTAIFGG
ncbi:L,D-transpeptidase [Aurantimonas endophytica]|uniref:Lipoprotein-anchoring transpeptidase ErfK/SrfK n=1 Tax=Aurantimonas endophytica TaxID=1522175 RepID=A0A7W6MPE6_9HYPH|nr:L,D-transpeptidase [Aurantimonas endophytica]MBB4002840.1 lipoprotein-anchoring transpeptidase ErfK/SrfK [Aurantimonas endophytica]MCO6403717.1 L,D-transpeptidase family protein [Aurantimonas endophytica]